MSDIKAIRQQLIITAIVASVIAQSSTPLLSIIGFSVLIGCIMLTFISENKNSKDKDQ